MTKKKIVPAKKVRQVLTQIVATALNHIICLNNEMAKMNIKDPKEAPVEDRNRLAAMTHTIILINDLIHPAHKIAKDLLNKCEDPIVDLCIKIQADSIKNKLIDACLCDSCIKEENGK